MTKTAFVKTEKAYVKAEKVTVTTPKQPPKRTDIKNPLTPEQRKQLRELLNEWVINSNLAKKPIAHGKAWNKLYEYGLFGAVNGIEQIEQTEFEQCLKFINQQIMIIQSNSKGAIREQSNWRNKRIGIIQGECNKKGISNETRKAFMLDKWGKDSLTELTDEELQECYLLAKRKSFSWKIPKFEIQGTQEQREKSLNLLLTELEEKGDFDRHNITIKKPDFLTMLVERDRTLWTDADKNPIAETTFNRFLTKAKLCKFKAGRK